MNNAYLLFKHPILLLPQTPYVVFILVSGTIIIICLGIRASGTMHCPYLGFRHHTLLLCWVQASNINITLDKIYCHYLEIRAQCVALLLGSHTMHYLGCQHYALILSWVQAPCIDTTLGSGIMHYLYLGFRHHALPLGFRHQHCRYLWFRHHELLLPRVRHHVLLPLPLGSATMHYPYINSKHRLLPLPWVLALCVAQQDCDTVGHT